MKLEGLLGRPVQIVSLGEAESSPTLLAEAVRDGRVVVDRDRAWERLRREEAVLIRRAQASEAELQAAARETLRHFAR